MSKEHPASSELLLEGKNIVVTGGAGLLGKTFCRAITDHGGVVVVADMHYEAAMSVAAELNASREGCAVPFLLDITSEDSLLELLAFLPQRFEHIHGLVNNAYPRNAHYGRALENVLYKDFCENLSLHLGGYFLTAQQFALFFRAQGHGNIVNMGSIYGVMAPRFSVYRNTSMTMPVEYAAIKAGILHLTRYFAQYFKKNNIRVNSLSPGGIEDSQPESFLEMYASFCGTGGMLTPQDIAGTLIFLLSDASRFITGQNIIVDDGFSL